MPLSTTCPPPPPPPRPAPGFHGAVTEFKRRLIEATLFQLGGNRTRTARALGLQRTYLLRLIREFGVNVPHQAAPPRSRDPRPSPVSSASASARGAIRAEARALWDSDARRVTQMAPPKPQ